MGGPAPWEGEGFEGVGGGVAETIFQGRREGTCPDFVGAGLEGAEGGVGVEGEDIECVREDRTSWQETHAEVRSGSTISHQHSV